MGKGIHTRVVSKPSWELFESQLKELGVRTTLYNRGPTGRRTRRRAGLGAVRGALGRRNRAGPRLGASVPYEDVIEHLGFIAAIIAYRAKAVIAVPG